MAEPKRDSVTQTMSIKTDVFGGDVNVTVNIRTKAESVATARAVIDKIRSSVQQALLEDGGTAGA